MILMLKIVSALNGFSVRKSVTTLGIELQLQFKTIIFQQKILFFNKKMKKILFVFWKKINFWLIFFGNMEDDLKIFIISWPEPAL